MHPFRDLTKSLLSRQSSDDARIELIRVCKLLPVPIDLRSFDQVPEPVSVDFSSIPRAQSTYLSANFLKKVPIFDGYQPRDAALEKFWACEKLCEASNRRIRAHRTGFFESPLQPIMLMAQRKIARVLGSFDVHELLQVSRWGPGATSSTRMRVDSSAKFNSRPDTTTSFLPKARLLMPHLPSWAALLTGTDHGTIVNPHFSIVRGNSVTFVPKTAKTHRAIAIEPHINVFFQNGLGRMIRRRLKERARVDLDNQGTNRSLARFGSLDDSLATIDLEGASDTICIELVRDLLPEDWFEWLNAARSHFGELDGNVFRYQKFSSMGNGATFDLESLIFWALSSAVVELHGYNSFWVNVFGDDIIVPSGCYEKVVEVLNLAGFVVNKEKSFSQGPFRESCGEDYLSGVNIRPIFVRRLPRTAVDWIILANQVRILAHRWNSFYGCDRRLRPLWEFCVSRIPKNLRYFVPYGYHIKRNVAGGFDGNGLLGNFDEAHPSRIRRDHPRMAGWDGFTFRGIVQKPITVTEMSRSRLTAGVGGSLQCGNEIPLRSRTLYREGTLFVPVSWYDLGPWL